MARSAHRTAENRSIAGWIVFGLAIFLPAFLIFFVQPMVGKRVLPWFGGAPAVWAVCLSFYQTALFAGYAYAHLLTRFVPPKLQLFVHAGLVAMAILARPILPDSSWAIGDHANPIREILAMLSIHVALPFMLLASSGPLVQSWFSKRHPESSPYPLYALSNFGSLLALCAYPFWIEPRFGLEQTGEFWSWNFIGAMALVLLSAELARRAAYPATSSTEPTPRTSAHERLQRSHIALWILLPAAAVLMLNALTNRLCVDVASVPFLWILPLGTYLVTFILSFSSESVYRRGPYYALVFVVLAISSARMMTLMIEEARLADDLGRIFGSIQVGIASMCLLLFALCSILHGELYRLRPEPEKLTAFYLCISGGGAIGGLFVGIAAPALFDRYAEFSVGLVLSLALGAHCATRDSGGLRASWRKSSLPLRAFALIGVLLTGNESFQAIRPTPDQTHQERNFFGVLRVLESGGDVPLLRQLMHGSTIHGTQHVRTRETELYPTTYYGQASPLATLIKTLPQGRNARIGVVGLGVGTIAAYGRNGDLIRFYEIDPAVIKIARDDSMFTFLANSQADVEIRQGDARLLLEAEQREGDRQDFDILVIDAFSSDAVPIHLLTREAFETYADSLSKSGVIAVHASNRHFALPALIARVSFETSLEHLLSSNISVPNYVTTPSKWVLLARNRQRLARIRKTSPKLMSELGMTPEVQQFQIASPEQLTATPLWTDDYSDLFGLLKPKSLASLIGKG